MYLKVVVRTTKGDVCTICMWCIEINVEKKKSYVGDQGCNLPIQSKIQDISQHQVQPSVSLINGTLMNIFEKSIHQNNFAIC